MAARPDLPTLTEVIELQQGDFGADEPTAPMPIQDESVALEERCLELDCACARPRTGSG